MKKTIKESEAKIAALNAIGGKPKRAMMDMKATHREKSFYNADWANPRLDSKTGTHQAANAGGQP